MSDKIAYIKIPKIDNSGNDISATLSSLTQITIPYTNGVKSVCPIIGITDAGDYFTYVVGETISTVPDQNDTATLDYIFTGSLGAGTYNAPSFVSGNPNLQSRSNLIQITDSSNDPLNFYDEINNQYFLNTISQKSINIKTKIVFQPPSAQFTTINFGIFIIPPGVTTLTFNTALTEFNGINGNNPYLYKVDPSGPYNSSIPLTSEFDVDVPLGKIPPGSSIQVRLLGGLYNTSATILAGSEIYISSTPAAGPVIRTVPEPFFTTKFEGSDCDVTFGSVDKYAPNPFLQDLDYSTDPLTPINIERIISGTAEKGTVPESYYTSHAQINSRYLGSKNQSTGVNIFKKDAGLTDFGTPVNVGNYGNVSPISENEINLFEYEWGGSTYPMISGYGQVKMSNILQISSKDQVRIVQKTTNAVKKLYPDERLLTTSYPNIRTYRLSDNPLDPRSSFGSVVLQSRSTKYYWNISQSRGEFYQTLNGSNPVNSIIQLGNYSANHIKDPIMPNTSKIAATGWGTPSKPDYMFTSSFNNGQKTPFVNGSTFPISQWISGSYGVIRETQAYQLILSKGDKISKTLLNSVGAVTIDKDPNATLSLERETVLDGLNSSMTQGSRWYVTLYRQLNDPGPSQSLEDVLGKGTNLQPYNFGYNQLNDNGDYDYPLAARGVYEIVGTNIGGSGNTYDSSTVFAILKPEVKFDPKVVSGSAYLKSGSMEPDGIGALKFGSNLLGSLTSSPNTSVDGIYNNVFLGFEASNPAQARVTVAGGGITEIIVTFAGSGYYAGLVTQAYAGQLGAGSGAFELTIQQSDLFTYNYPNPLGVPSGSFDVQVSNQPTTFPDVRSSNYDITCSISVSDDTTFVSVTNLSVVTPYGQIVDDVLVRGWVPGDVINFPADQFSPALGDGMNFVITAANLIDNQVKIINIGTSDSNYYNQYKDSPNNNLGAFMWEATGKEQITGEEYVVVQDKLEGVGPGYFMDKFVPEYITNDVEKITKEYGSNKT